MKNANNNFSENYGKCVHSSICTADDTDLIFRKAYKGDWGDWDEQPDTTKTDLDCYDRAELIVQELNLRNL